MWCGCAWCVRFPSTLEAPIRCIEVPTRDGDGDIRGSGALSEVVAEDSRHSGAAVLGVLLVCDLLVWYVRIRDGFD